MTDIRSLVSDIQEGRRRFLELVDELRPDLHRYCARMTGSVSEAEDIVQEALARAYYTLPEIERLPPLRAWLFQVAHRLALDHLRRYDRRMGRPLEELEDVADPGVLPEEALAREEAVHAALSVFLELPPFPRSCVVLKDVLGHSVDEIAALLEQTPAAVKAALHRGRTRLRALRPLREAAAAERPPFEPVSETVVRWAALFNARDWDGVRALLSDDVRLDLVSRSRRSGRREVEGYVANYSRFDDWFLVPARLDGAEVVAGFRNPHRAKPSYFIELGVAGGRVVSIRDFRYVPYICVDAALQVAERPSAASFRRTVP
jgi:RNA polymerase sigma-70 factor (ECF subfamily)